MNKALLATLIFENEANRNYVNSVIHPIVRADFEQWKTRQTHSPFVVIETAILFETGRFRSVDVSVTVAAPEELRIRRIALREGWSHASIVSRIRSQISEEERIWRSDYVIYNDDRRAVIPQVEKVVAAI